MKTRSQSNTRRWQFALVLLAAGCLGIAALPSGAKAELTVASPDQSYAEGPGLVGGLAGEGQTFTIHAVDAAGSPVITGGDTFIVSITGPGPVSPAVTDNGDGTYGVAYTATKGGSYTVDVKFNGTSIRDMPRTVAITNVYALSWQGPVAGPPAVDRAKADKKAKLTWSLTDAAGDVVSSLNAVTSVRYMATSCAVFTTDPAGSTAVAVAKNGELAYDPLVQRFTLRWATPGPGCYTVFVTLESGQVFHAFFELKP